MFSPALQEHYCHSHRRDPTFPLLLSLACVVVEWWYIFVTKFLCFCPAQLLLNCVTRLWGWDWEIFQLLPVVYLHYPVVMLLCRRPPRKHLKCLQRQTSFPALFVIWDKTSPSMGERSSLGPLSWHGSSIQSGQAHPKREKNNLLSHVL